MGREVEDPNELIRRRRKVGASSAQHLEASASAETGERESGSTATLQSGRAEERESGETGKRDNGIAEESYSAITVKPQNAIAVSMYEGKTGEREGGKAVERQSGETELNDQKITLYLSWRLLDKLEDMATEYRHRTRKRIDHNKLMRMMIEKATLDDLV